MMIKTRRVCRARLLLGIVVCLAHPTVPICRAAGAGEPAKDPNWFALRPVQDSFGPTILDCSRWVEAPTGQHGFVTVRGDRFVFEDGTPARFWGAQVGGFSKEQIDYAVRRMRRQGINITRMHGLENLSDRSGRTSFDYSESGFDRLDYLIWRLGENGIYLILDVHYPLTYRFKPGDEIPGLPQGGPAPHAEFFNEKVAAVMHRRMADVFTHLNPYTKKRYCDDPTLALVEVLNEDSLFWGEIASPFREELEQKFTDWLRAKYSDEAGLRRAWSVDGASPLAPDEGVEPGRRISLLRSTQLMSRYFQNNPRQRMRGQDQMRFLLELEDRYWADSAAAMRKAGVKVPISATNWQGHEFATRVHMLGQSKLDYIDRHGYWDHPQGEGNAKWRIATALFHNLPMVKALKPEQDVLIYLGRGNLVTEKAWEQVLGLPMTISEWNTCLPNEHSLEGTGLLAAYGLLQGWDGLLEFGYFSPDWRESLGPGSFDLFGNPPQILQFPAVATMWHRQDIREADVVAESLYDAESVFGVEADRKPVPIAAALVGKVGYRFVPQRREPIVRDLHPYWNPETLTARSITGELTWNASAGFVTVDTARTQAVIGFLNTGEHRLAAVTLDSPMSFGAVYVTAMDGEAPIESARRLLVTAVGPARNTGMAYESTTQPSSQGTPYQRLREAGAAPALLQAVTGGLAIRSHHAGRLKAWALDIVGSRVREVPLVANGDAVVLDMRPEHQTVYYEISAGEAENAPPSAEARTQWQQVEGTRIPMPPAEHPRLYLRAEHVRQLPQRLKESVLQPAVERMQAQAKRSPQFKVEWDALRYLATRDAQLGRTTIEAVLPLLQKCELADRMDACRETGRMMVTGAIVYDWCYGLLTPDEKQAFIQELVRLAKTQECGYPPTGQGSVTGHSSEAMIMRDMLSAGIAIYDEFPEMYRLAAGRFFREHLPARNWFYPGHAYHQGDSYGPHRYSWDTYPLWIFDRLGAGNVYDPAQQFVPYLWIYTTRPDGQRLRAGDTFAHSASRGRPWDQYIGTLLTASYYHDGILLDQFQRQGGSGGNETIFEVLWRDTDLQAKSVDTLPLSRYCGSPFGWMIARTGWGQDAVIAEMKVNEYNFVNHQHLDAGAFQIYYRGPLAIDSGLYSGSSGAYGSPHCMNYYWRTIAHNSLLVRDPNEDFGRRGYGNDGGQRLPNGRSEARDLTVLLDSARGYRTGKVLSHGLGPDPRTPDFTLLQGDITAAYSKKVRQVTRSFVFLNLRNAEVPAAMVVFDRVVSADPASRKYWLLHTLEEPRVDSTSAAVDCTQHGTRGRLTLDVLLPPAENADLAKVGGPGKEFWVFGNNYANDLDPQRLARGSMEPGAWRIELSPKTAAAEDLFLNVMQVTDRQSLSRWPVRRLEAGERVGCIIEGPETTWIVLFRKDGQRSEESVSFTSSADRPCRVLVTDLAPGRWRVQPPGSAEFRTLTVAAESGAAWLEGPPGAWTLSPQASSE